MAGVGNIGTQTIAKLRITEDGSISNRKVEQYALLRSEEVVSITAAWIITMKSAGGNLPTGSYQQNIHKSRIFKARLEALMAEKAELQETPWGQVEWQTKQNYRRAAALNDTRAMQASTELLYKILMRGEKPEKAPKPETAEGDEPRGRGAPPVPTPLEEDTSNDYFAERLIGMKGR